jgi:hypothetical protein
MKKLVLVLSMLALVAPAWARVDILCQPTGPNEVTVSYNSTQGEIRAFALDVTVDSGATIVGISDFVKGESVAPGNKGYGIFPANFDRYINPSDPNFEADANYTPVAQQSDYPSDTLGGFGTGGMTVEMGSLYVGETNSPDDAGMLFKFTVDKDCNVAIAQNVIRSGVVMKTGDSVSGGDFNSPGGIARSGCLVNDGSQEYTDWVTWNKPPCWCYPRQCRGDIDGLKTGLWHVYSPDLTVFRAAFFLQDAQLAAVPNGICADLDHVKTGLWRVYSSDLTIFRTYFFKQDPQVPLCDQTPVITGPYHFWMP